jgi:hypothetical protein
MASTFWVVCATSTQFFTKLPSIKSLDVTIKWDISKTHFNGLFLRTEHSVGFSMSELDKQLLFVF